MHQIAAPEVLYAIENPILSSSFPNGTLGLEQAEASDCSFRSIVHH